MDKKSNVIIAAGATGGHISPGLAIADALSKEISDVNITFIGTKKGLESKLIPKAGYELKFISMRMLKRKFGLSMILFPFWWFIALIQSWFILRKIRPIIVIGCAGYVSAPVIMIANMMKIPTLIQEQNVYPGAASRVCARFANVICLAFESSSKYIKTKGKILITGNPLRSDIENNNPEIARKEFKLDNDRQTILITGGSQGAHGINKLIAEALKYFHNETKIQFIWQTGETDFDSMKSLEDSISFPLRICKFIYNMPDALGLADLVICRAGAITLNELNVLGKPSILIPYPYAPANHQEKNARELEKYGASIVVLENEITGERLKELISKLLKDKEKLANMSKRNLELGKREATKIIINEIMELVSE